MWRSKTQDCSRTSVALTVALFIRKASCMTRLFPSAKALCCAAGSSMLQQQCGVLDTPNPPTKSSLSLRLAGQSKMRTGRVVRRQTEETKTAPLRRFRGSTITRGHRPSDRPTAVGTVRASVGVFDAPACACGVGSTTTATHTTPTRISLCGNTFSIHGAPGRRTKQLAGPRRDSVALPSSSSFECC